RQAPVDAELRHDGGRREPRRHREHERAREHGECTAPVGHATSVASVDIVRLEVEQLGVASAVLARAFADDPAWAWVIPDVRRRAALLPWLFRTGFESADAEVWT